MPSAITLSHGRSGSSELKYTKSNPHNGIIGFANPRILIIVLVPRLHSR